LLIALSGLSLYQTLKQYKLRRSAIISIVPIAIGTVKKENHDLSLNPIRATSINRWYLAAAPSGLGVGGTSFNHRA
jgi:hypothetical protein